MKIRKSNLVKLYERKNETMEVTCEECGAEYTLVPGDVRMGTGGYNFQFKCFCCEEWTRIDWHKMTESFRNMCLWYNNGSKKPPLH